MILEGNFFILDKRVNLLKKDNRDAIVSRNLQKAEANMQEVFGQESRNTCSIGGTDNMVSTCCFIPVQKVEDITVMTTIVDDKNSQDDVQISFSKAPQVDVETPDNPDDIISMIEATATETIENDNHETMSIASEITFNTDEGTGKYSQKKLSKLNIDKIKDICTNLNINAEGTKAQLIAKILENK